MTPTRSQCWLAYGWGLLALALIGCPTESPPNSGEGIVQAGHGGEASGGAGGSQGEPVHNGDLGRPSVVAGYSVQARAESTRLCPGECTTLLATSQGGISPVRYAWSPSAMQGGGPFEVCPEETTTFEVTATDSRSSLEEFGGDDRSATDAVQITVTPDCDEPEPTEGDHTPGSVQCELRVAYGGSSSSITPFTGWAGVPGTIATDAHENAYFVATISGELAIGNTTVEATGGGVAGLVVKLDRSCETVWVKTFQTTGDGSVVLGTIAVTPDGEVYVAGSLRGQADFGDGQRTASEHEEGLLLRLAADGSVVWSAITHSGSLLFLNDVVIGDDGNIVVAGFGYDGVTLNGVGLDIPTPDTMSFVFGLSPEGEVRYARGMLGHPSPVNLAPLAGGAVALVSSSYATLSFEVANHIIDAPTERWVTVVVTLDAAGDFVWGKAVRPLEARWSSISDTAFASDGDQRLVFDRNISADLYSDDDGTIDSLTPELFELDATGQELWAMERPYVRGGDTGWSGTISIDGDGNLLHFDEVFDGALAGDSTLEVEGASDVILEKRSPSGELSWFHQVQGPYLEWGWAATAASDGAVWMGSGEQGDAEGRSRALVITRLAP